MLEINTEIEENVNVRHQALIFEQCSYVFVYSCAFPFTLELCQKIHVQSCWLSSTLVLHCMYWSRLFPCFKVALKELALLGPFSLQGSLPLDAAEYSLNKVKTAFWKAWAIMLFLLLSSGMILSSAVLWFLQLNLLLAYVHRTSSSLFVNDNPSRVSPLVVSAITYVKKLSSAHSRNHLDCGVPVYFLFTSSTQLTHIFLQLLCFLTNGRSESQLLEKNKLYNRVVFISLKEEMEKVCDEDL